MAIIIGVCICYVIYKLLTVKTHGSRHSEEYHHWYNNVPNKKD